MIRSLVVTLALVLALAGAAVAQAPPEEGQPRRPRDEVFKMVDAYVVSNLQESLSLSEEQFVKILPLVRRLQTNRRAAVERRMSALRELRKLMASGTATEARAVELLREVKAVEMEEAAQIRQDRDALDAVLTPIQQAKFRIMEAEVDHRIRELVGRMGGQRMGGQRPPGMGGQRPPAGRRRGAQPPPNN